MADPTTSTSTGYAPPGTGLVSGSRELRRLNGAMLFAALAAFGLLYSTQALLPAVGASFGVGPTAASLTVSAATGALALAILPLSAVAESVGRVPVMRTGLLVACLFTFVAAAAPAFWVLLVARGLVGVSLAAVVAVAVAHLGDEVHPAELGTAIGVYVAGNTLGGISGRLIRAWSRRAARGGRRSPCSRWSRWSPRWCSCGCSRGAGGRPPPRPARASTSPPCATCCATAASSGCACWPSC